jgi:hypothetical protein
MFAAFIIGSGISHAATQRQPTDGSRLIVLAAKTFPNLTRAERAMLWYSDIDNIGRGEFAAAGPSAKPGDPSNDPAHAEQWEASRQIRASLIRWLCVNHEALALIDPKGIRVVGARIAGVLDLSLVSIPIPIVLDQCVFTDTIDLAGAESPYIELDGSYVAEVHASGLIVRNNLSLAKGFHSIGAVFLDHAKIGLDLDCGGSRFYYAKNPGEPFLDRLRVSLFAYLIQVGGNVWLNRGFESHGAVDLGGATIGGNLHFDSGHFINPNNVAISAPGASVGGVIFLIRFDSDGDAKVTGSANFSYDRVGNSVIVDHARFLGPAGGQQGFIATGISVERAFTWRNVTLQNGAQLDLSDAAVGSLRDDEQSWPAPGRLMIDGLTYNSLTSERVKRLNRFAHNSAVYFDPVRNRLQWLALQPPGFHSQPYTELAKYYANSGEEAAAVRVYIAGEDDRYSRFGLFGYFWGGLLKNTIGYGHRPLLAFDWSMLIIVLGWAAVLMGKRAGVMRLTWPENLPPPSGDIYAGLHPLLYSLDVFLPFVNLHQEGYWWPDHGSKGECNFAGRRIAVRGSALRIYLWLQIIAGWLLSAIFIAGVTGLIRSD